MMCVLLAALRETFKREARGCFFDRLYFFPQKDE